MNSSTYGLIVSKPPCIVGIAYVLPCRPTPCPNIVSQCAEKNGVFAVLGVEGAELGEVFAEQSVGLCLGELTASAVGLARLDLMTISDIGPVSWLMECFKLHQLNTDPTMGMVIESCPESISLSIVLYPRVKPTHFCAKT